DTLGTSFAPTVVAEPAPQTRAEQDEGTWRGYPRGGGYEGGAGDQIARQLPQVVDPQTLRLPAARHIDGEKAAVDITYEAVDEAPGVEEVARYLPGVIDVKPEGFSTARHIEDEDAAVDIAHEAMTERTQIGES